MWYPKTVTLFNFIARLLIISFLVLALRKFYFQSNLLVHPEFFINYSGGFIRRGLDGSLMLMLSNIFNVTYIHIIQTYNIVTFSGFLLALLFFKLNRKVPAYILFYSSALLLYFTFIDRGLRKDHIVLLLLLGMSSFFSNPEKLKIFRKQLLFVVISCIGTLIHEVFFIISFFPNLIGIWLISENHKKQFCQKSILLLPSVLLFLLIFTVARGTESQVASIIRSHQNTGYNLDYLNQVFTKSFLFWQQNYNLKNILLFFFMIFLNAVAICTAVYNHLGNTNLQKKGVFLLLLSFQIVVLIGLCLVAIDYGRWIAISFLTTIFYIYNYDTNTAKVPLVPTFIDEKLMKLKWLPFLLYFLLAMPHSHWNGKESIYSQNILILLKQKINNR